MSAITTRLTISSIILAAVCSLLTVYLRARGVAHAADQFLRAAKSMPIDQLSQKQVRDLWQQYHRYGSVERCSGERCELELHFNNVWISTWKLAPFTELYAVFVIDRGSPSAKRIGMLTQTNMLDVWEDLPKSDPFKVLANPPHRVEIVLTSQASIEERADAYNLDTGCLTRMGGCKNIEQMNPSIGKYQSAGPIVLN